MTVHESYKQKPTTYHYMRVVVTSYLIVKTSFS